MRLLQLEEPLPSNDPTPPLISLALAHVFAALAHVNEVQAVRNFIGRQQIEDLVHGGGGGHGSTRPA